MPGARPLGKVAEGTRVIEAYPLCWPHGRPRTGRYNRQRAKFDVTFARARDDVSHEIELLTGRYAWMIKEANLIISTNVALRRDGLPLAGQRQPDDPGVAVYFTYKKRPMCFACDRWDKIEDNMRAIAKTIEALRGVARWGTGDMMEAAFTGFTALPAPSTPAGTWREILGLHPGERDADVIRSAYMTRRGQAHPDRGGDPAQFNRIQQAWEQAERELGHGR